MKDNKFKIGAKVRAVEKLKKTLPTKVGNMAKNHFVKSFRDGGFTDSGLQSWKPRRPNARRNKGRAILVNTGNLRRSVRLMTATFDKTLVSSDLIYAAVHNYGQRAGRGRGFIMPKRKFMGNSKVLERNMKDKIITEINRVIK